MKATKVLSRSFSFCICLALLLSFLPVQIASAVSPDVVISQVYGGGGNAGAPFKNDFVELFNRGTNPVSLNGWSIQYASATGSGNFGGNPITLLSGTLKPGQYYLAQQAGGTNGVALPTPDAIGTVNMSATGGKIALVTSTSGLACNGGSTACTPAQLALIKDLIGWDGANFYETAAAPATSSTTADLRKLDGAQDTDNNSTDFIAGPPNPRNTAYPFIVVSLASPDTLFAGENTLLTVSVTPSPSVPSTGLTVVCDLSAIGGTGSQSLFDDGTNGDVLAGDDIFSYYTLEAGNTPAGQKSLACTVSDTQNHLVNTVIALNIKLVAAIHDVQGAQHFSPVNGVTVELVPAVVTALRTTGSTRGFYLQDPNPDANLATSEGIFVFTGGSSNPAGLVTVGDEVQVTGKVSEYRGSAASLTLTELVAPLTVTKISSGNPLPNPVILGSGGQIPPSTIIEDDATGNVETTGVFDPANDGIDFYESLEGMLVQVNDAVAVGPQSNFTSNHEIPVVGDNGANAGVRTNRGGLVAQANDFNPERIILNDWISGGPTLPAANVGDKFPGTTLGVIDYSFNNYKLQVISMPTLVSGGLTQEAAASAGLNQISIAAFNVENLAPTDPPSKFSTLAELIVSHLQSPDIMSIEEIQDNSGATDNGVVDASTTWNLLISAIQTAGGPTYSYRQIDPVNDQDGGATGGNIRVGFLFRTDRGLSFIDRPGAGSTTPNGVTGTGIGTQLLYSPGRIDPTNPAFNTSRKPLAGEFMFNGHHLFVIANHWNSKSGDDPLFGVKQPPVFISEVQRNQQATVVHDFVNAILTADPNANVVVMGDLNDFQFSSALATLTGNSTILTDLIDTLPVAERYTYVYEGNSETLDHILTSSALTARPYVYDVVHVNSEFAIQASDHEPQAFVVTLNDPPTVDAGGPYSVVEGSSVTLYATGSDPENGPLTYAWDLNNDGVFETPGQSASFDASALIAPQVLTVAVQVTDDGGLTATNTATVNVIYKWSGFFIPLENQPEVNKVNAGSSVPIKFSLSGDRGMDVIATGYPVSQQVTCDKGSPVGEPAQAQIIAASYDPLADQYVFVWKTDSSWAGTCRQLAVMLIDGTTHMANFKFK